MGCLKCGKDTKDENVFCPQCLATMENYPVKSDIHIQLPNHEARELAKKNAKKKKRAPSLEEQIEILRTRNRRLAAIIVLLVLMLFSFAACTSPATPPADTDGTTAAPTEGSTAGDATEPDTAPDTETNGINRIPPRSIRNILQQSALGQ